MFVIRAKLSARYAALDAMGSKPKRKQPENAGKPWTSEEDILRELFVNGVSKKEICKTLKRTETGVAARLVHLGLIDDRDVFLYRL